MAPYTYYRPELFVFLFICALCTALSTHLPPAAQQLLHEPAFFYPSYCALIKADLPLLQADFTNVRAGHSALRYSVAAAGTGSCF